MCEADARAGELIGLHALAGDVVGVGVPAPLGQTGLAGADPLLVGEAHRRLPRSHGACSSNDESMCITEPLPWPRISAPNIVDRSANDWRRLDGCAESLRRICRYRLRDRHLRLANPTLLYFYCHATSIDTDPDRSAIIMGAQTNRDEFITLGDLNLDAPMTVKLAWQPLVILNARLRIGPTSRHASMTDSSRTSRPRAVGV